MEITMGKVFNIQRFSLHDGPGIRTTCFLMGCSLSCRWCHNPEGMSGRIQLQYNDRDCIGCGACAEVCEQKGHQLTPEGHIVSFDRCIGCGACVQKCPTKALQFSGKEYTPQELAAAGIRDKLFYKDNGGVTFSGGEPLLQAEFVAETARLCREGGVPTITVDTAGNVEWTAFEKVLPYTDYFLFDVKAASREAHIRGTGCSNERIQENLRRLDETGKTIYIRVPVIPGINDSREEMEAIGRITGSLKHAAEVRLLPYHTFGREKYLTLGCQEPELFETPDDAKMEELNRIIADARR